jgi:hypothetical protein
VLVHDRRCPDGGAGRPTGGFRHHQLHAVRSSLIHASKGASHVHSGHHGEMRPVGSSLRGHL